MLTIELVGSDRACHGSLTVRKSKGDPVPLLCRNLIRQGHAADSLVSVQRNGKPSFLPCTLATWAAIDISDSDVSGLSIHKHREFAGIPPSR